MRHGIINGPDSDYCFLKRLFLKDLPKKLAIFPENVDLCLRISCYWSKFDLQTTLAL